MRPERSRLAPSHAQTPPRVLFVIDALSKNGAVQITLDLARRWSPYGAAVAVVSRCRDSADIEVPSGVPVRHLSTSGIRLRGALAQGLPKLVAQARRADVVVAGSEIGFGFLAAAVAAGIARKPFVVAVHADVNQALEEWMPHRTHALFRWTHRRVAGAVCVDAGLVPSLVSNGLPPDRIRVVRNGVDTQAILRAGQGPGSLVEGNVPVVVASGRLAPQKGYDLLLRAHARIVRDIPHRLLILNDGPELGALQALAAELGVQASVQFAGAVASPHPSVADADVFCLPSRHEGLPLALLEALVLGVPVIAADCSDGVRTALDGGRLGQLVPVEDVTSLAAALKRHLQDPERMRALASRGQLHARTFDNEVMAKGWAEALLHLTSDRGGVR